MTVERWNGGTVERWNGGTSDRVILSEAKDLLFPGLRFAFFRGIRAFSRSIGFQQDSARQLELLMTRKRARMRENSPMIPSGPKAPLHEPLAFHRSTVPPFHRSTVKDVAAPPAVSRTMRPLRAWRHTR